MKIKISKLISGQLLLAGLALFGCKESDLERIPTSIVSPETVFATTKNAYAAINGIHRYLYSQWYSNQAQGGQSANMIYMDVMGEDFVMTAAANGFFNSEYKWLEHRNANSGMLRYNYGFYYAIIGNANQILANVDAAVGPEADKNNLKAQALTYRAWSYHQMIQLFSSRYVKGEANSGLGLSLILEPTSGAVARSTVEQVYTQINKDLDDAIALFANASPRADKSHLNVNVAKGVKARVALNQQNYADAAKFAKEAREGFPLMNQTDYMAGFSDYKNAEWIWGVYHREDQPTYFYSFFAYLGSFSSTNTRGNPKAINSKLYSKISKTDIRKQLWDSTGKNTNFPVVASGVRMPYMTRKFMLANSGSSNGDLCFMRASEMYLIEAEALASLGRDSDAADALLPLAKARDTAYTKSTKTGASLLEEILTQRRVELWGEGFRFYDLKRLNLPLDRNGANHVTSLAVTMDVPAGDIKWQFLIPQLEINYTLKVVEQNPL